MSMRVVVALPEEALASRIRVLIIEDNRFLRNGLTTALRRHGGFAVEACAAPREAMRRTSATPAPEVVLLDNVVEGERGCAVIRDLRACFPASRMIAMDMPADGDVSLSFIRSGGCAFILRNASVEDYVTTIQQVASGATVLPRRLTTSLFDQIAGDERRMGPRSPVSTARLTRREGEIVALICEGMSNKEIAQRLNIATFTVKSHVHNILHKLDLESRLQIAAFAHRGG